MPREITAYLYDIIDACDSIASILRGISIETYYASVDHETVYETALQDAPKLRRECVEILSEEGDVLKDRN